MLNLFQTLEKTAADGADGLTSEARESVTAALRALQGSDGGFVGLDGRSDPYYTFFAWLVLRALDETYDRDRLCVFMAAHRHDTNQIDAYCAKFLLAIEGRGKPVSWLKCAAAIVRGATREGYAAFLLMLSKGPVPRWVARLVWRRQQRLFGRPAIESLPTPRLAAGLALAVLAGADGADILPVLFARRCVSGGFAAVPNASPDLLATAVARFACFLGATESLSSCEKNDLASVPASPTREDLTFVEACWMENGLFGASPSALHGDSEYTFYGLLALGACRPLPGSGGTPVPSRQAYEP